MKSIFAFPAKRSLCFASMMFMLQMGFFAMGVYALSSWYTPTGQGLDRLIYTLYAYVIGEMCIFLLAGLLAYAFSKVVTDLLLLKEKVARPHIWLTLLLTEFALFLIVYLISVPFSISTCSSLASLAHFPVYPKPICGISSLNIFTPWFGAFAVLTVVAWSLLLADARKMLVTLTFSMRSILADAK